MEDLHNDTDLRVQDCNTLAGLLNINNGCPISELAEMPGSVAGDIQAESPREEAAGTDGVVMTVCDPDHMEERFRVDRKKLEQMLQGQLIHSV